MFPSRLVQGEVVDEVLSCYHGDNCIVYSGCNFISVMVVIVTVGTKLFCRNCIGKQFAFNEEKCVLAKILHHFEFSLDEERQPEVMATMITRAKNGLYLKVKKRNN